MKRLLLTAILVLSALWVAGCEVVETHYGGPRHGFYAPPPAVVYSQPMGPPPPVVVYSRPVGPPHRAYIEPHHGPRAPGRGR